MHKVVDPQERNTFMCNQNRLKTKITSPAGQWSASGEEVCHTICATKDRGCNAQHSFAEGGVNLLGAYNDDCEHEVQGPPGLDGRHIS